MPWFLSRRAHELKERMDDPHCDRKELFNTYRQFANTNPIISRWSYIYKNYILPHAKAQRNSISLLDIGFGGGDIPINLSQWANKDGIRMDITAIETDPRACRFVENLPDKPDNISFLNTSSSELVKQGKEFDIVISNHLIHHLDKEEFLRLLKEARTLSRKQVLFNDIERSDIAYFLFSILSRPIFRSSFITEDGLTSIKRSHTKNELAQTIPDDWSVRRIFPFRILLSYRHD